MRSQAGEGARTLRRHHAKPGIGLPGAPRRDRAANVRKAIGCYRRALCAYRAQIFPFENAAMHNNLGNAFFSVPATDQTAKNRNIWRASRHFERALEIRTRADHPCDYAETQLNRGQALLQLEDGNEEANWRGAIACFREAAVCFRQCGNHVNADFAQQRLRWAHSCLANRQAAEQTAA